ncbi:leucine-rich repeat-containing protein 24-like [Sipha flava]|uniref:Leucine-rich repeat-containing protein 24-like n=1 Tax=Sipha flava TaxID=143950 RepID=A0A8B8FIV1_9HEMI|nr:leucine-rich repeat-containing protein 24-like [Sipha flava]
MPRSSGRRAAAAAATVLVALLAVLPSARPFEGCPSVCSCKWKGGRRTVECADRALITVPTGVDSDTQVLDLSGNNLQILPNQTFARAGLANLQKVYLRNCRIGQIDETAFRGLTNLIELDLSNNLLTSVPTYVFRDIPFLRELSVARNPIQKIEARSFADCPGVVKVDASHCGLQSVAGLAFEGVTRLETLRINDNRLTELSATVLESLNKLRSIELHDNPWVCDCHLRPMKLWLSGNNVPYNQPALCAGGPERLSGKPLMELDVEDFDCRPDVRVESRYVEATEGDNVTVRCRVEPGSMAHIAWYLNGRRLQGLGPVTPTGSYRVAGLDLIHDHDASRLDMCDSPMSSTAKPPPSYYSGRHTTASSVRPYDDRTPIIGTGSAGDAYSVGTGSDEVFSYNSQQQLHYGGGGSHYAPQQHVAGHSVGGSVSSDYPADYGLPIIPPGQHHHQSAGNVSQHHQYHPQQHPQHHNHMAPPQQQYFNNQPQQDFQQQHQHDEMLQQPSVKTLRVWQRGVPVLPTTPSLQRFANRTSPITPGTDV